MQQICELVLLYFILRRPRSDMSSSEIGISNKDIVQPSVCFQKQRGQYSSTHVRKVHQIKRTLALALVTSLSSS
jgi:hypothetical protein